MVTVPRHGAAVVVVVVVLRQWLEGLVQLNVSTTSSLVSP